MTERIDHAAEALRYLPATGDGMNTGRIAVAQVHATLALVEQQRIANLVTYFATLNDIYTADPTQVSPQGMGRVSDLVYEGLGL